jgi:hypothetical protein
MDYTAILEALNKASLFDLHRLQSAIYQELINPVRVTAFKLRYECLIPLICSITGKF